MSSNIVLINVPFARTLLVVRTSIFFWLRFDVISLESIGTYSQSMKIQFMGGDSFAVKAKEGECILNPQGAVDSSIDFIAFSKARKEADSTDVKVLNLPGEFEISGILVEGFFTNNRENVVYKVVAEDIAIVHFGNLKEVPGTDFFESLGESVDIGLVTLSENFNDKMAKELIDKVDPRMVILSGDAGFFPKMVENAGAKNIEENPINITKSSLSDDKTDVVILNV